MYSIFSQTTGVDQAPEPEQFKYFSLFVSFLGSIFFSGLLISTINNSFQRRITNVLNGNVRYRLLRNHDVIIGANDLTFSVVQYLIQSKRSNKRIVILTNHSSHQIQDIRNRLDQKNKARIIIYRGDIYGEKTLEKLYLEKSNRIVVLGDQKITKSDSGNIHIISQISDILKEKKCDVKKCYVSYFDDLYVLKYCQDMKMKCPSLDIHPVNYYETWANDIWGYGHLSKFIDANDPKKPKESADDFKYSTLTQKKITPQSCNYVNIIILGISPMARELVKKAVKNCHYANYDKERGFNKTRITIISDNENDVNVFRTRYSKIDVVSDIKCAFITLSPFSKEAQKKIVNLICLANAVSTIAICSEDAEQNYMLATHLPIEVYQKEIQVVVAYPTFSHYIKNLHENTANVRFFGFMNKPFEMEYNYKIALFILKAWGVYEKRQCFPDEVKISESDDFKDLYERYSGNHLQTVMSFVNAIFSMLESMNLRLDKVDKNNKPSKEQYLELSETWFDKHAMFHQMVALNYLAEAPINYQSIENDFYKITLSIQKAFAIWLWDQNFYINRQI